MMDCDDEVLVVLDIRHLEFVDAGTPDYRPSALKTHSSGNCSDWMCKKTFFEEHARQIRRAAVVFEEASAVSDFVGHCLVQHLLGRSCAV